MTGILRNDVELLDGETPMLFDRPADVYYKISHESLKIIAFLTESTTIDDFLERLNKNGIAIKKEELLQLLGFLQLNNLLVPEYGHINVKRARHAEMKEKTAFLRLSTAYLFFLTSKVIALIVYFIAI